MTGGELTLGAVLARLEEREREFAAQAEAVGGRIAELTAQLEELHRTAEEVRITRKTLLELPEPPPPPLRARQVCEAMDLQIAPNNVNNARLKLKRLVERGILIETEQGLFTQPRP